MSIAGTNLVKTVLGAAMLALTFGCLGCGHANNADNGAAQATNKSTAEGMNPAQNAGQGPGGQASGETSTAYPNEGGTPSAEDAQAREMMRFSHHGHDAIVDIGAARIGLFDGHPKAAIQLMNSAQTAIDAAQRESSDFKMPQNPRGTHTAGGKKMNDSQISGGATMVPVDGRMSFGEEYVATPEKQSHIDKANQHLKNGETRQAIEELKLAGVDVSFTLVLMPIDTSRQELQQALSLAKQGKYYEANLQLKKIEDSLIITQESLISAPKNGRGAKGENGGGVRGSGTGAK